MAAVFKALADLFVFEGHEAEVLLAAALLHDPKLLVFDEPLSGLDVVSARLFKDLLEELASEGKAILYISHVLEVVEQVCSRVIVLSQGKMLADAPPAELRSATNLSSLEHVFAQLVQQQETRSVARGVVEAIRGRMVRLRKILRGPEASVRSLAVQANAPQDDRQMTVFEVLTRHLLFRLTHNEALGRRFRRR